jgi:hypothetical protein
MKPILQTNHRYRPIRLAAGTGRLSRKTDYNYQAATLDDVDGGCLSDCKPRFRAIGRDYFAREAHFDWASEALVSCLLMLTTIPPLVDGVSAVAGLLRSTGGAL